MRLRLGTRRSALAMAQSGMMARALEERHPGLTVELVPLTTTGDVVTSRSTAAKVSSRRSWSAGSSTARSTWPCTA